MPACSHIDLFLDCPQVIDPKRVNIKTFDRRGLFGDIYLGHFNDMSSLKRVVFMQVRGTYLPPDPKTLLEVCGIH
jgi:hypothetical protein